MSKELLDVLDENGLPTGEVLSRDEVHHQGLWHRAIVVAVINDHNEILLQQRSTNKEKNANLWDISVAGHLAAGQDSLSAAAREISEEINVFLGYKTEIKDFRYMTCFRKEQKYSDNFIERQFYDFFVLRTSKLEAASIQFQQSEVQAVRFADLATIQQLASEGVLVERPEVYRVLHNYLFRF